jgi:hypothetical protein
MLKQAWTLIDEAMAEILRTQREWETKMWDQPQESEELRAGYGELHKAVGFLQDAKSAIQRANEGEIP